MNTKAPFLAGIVLVSASLLSACGGGGDDGGATTTAVTTSPGAPATPAPAPSPSPAPAPTPSPSPAPAPTPAPAPAPASVEKKLTLDLSTAPTDVALLGTYTVSSFAGDAITFDAAAGNLCDDVLYDRRVDNFNFDGLYRARSGSTDYFFRFGWQDCSGPASKLRFVQWANGVVPPAGTYTFSAVSKDRAQNGTKTLTTIGDSITWWNNGELLRVLLAQRRTDFKFTGSRTDTYGFGHDGEGGNGSAQVLTRLAGIPVSDAYHLLIGTNDTGANNLTTDNIKVIVAGLLAKNPAATVYVGTLLPRGDAKDSRNQSVSADIRAWVSTAGDTRIRLIDFDASLRGLAGWVGMLADGIHPNAAGYDLLVNIMDAAL